MEESIPFQVQLERRQHRLLKKAAARRGRSMGSLVRESVEAYLATLPAEDDPAFAIVGMLTGDDGPQPYGDVATHHDAYLAEVYAAEAGEPADAERRSGS